MTDQIPLTDTVPVMVPPAFRVIAHRGASAYAPENTRPAFELALAMGRPEVELDAQLSRDGQVVLCHDHTLARYGHGPRVIESMTWAELSGLDMGAWFSPHHFTNTPMLTLADLFSVFGDRLQYHLEIKGEAAGLPAAIGALIREHGLADRVIITSFRFEALAAMKALRLDLRLGWLVPRIDTTTLAAAAGLTLFQLCPRADAISPTDVQAALTHAAEVRAWGVNGNPAEVRSLVRQVVAAGGHGLTLNWPDWAQPAG